MIDQRNDLVDRESEPETEAILALVRSRGGRITTPRRLLVGALCEESTHQTAEELANRVQERAPEIHMSTVYRNLDELEKLGVVRHVHLGHGPAVYHLSADNHGHLVCEHCGRVIEAPPSVFTGLDRSLRTRFGFRAQTRHFAVQGICEGCATGPQSPARPHD